MPTPTPYPNPTQAPTAASLASEQIAEAERRGEATGRKRDGSPAHGPPFKTDKDRRAWLLHEKRQWIVAARLAKRDDATEPPADSGKLPAINVGRGSSLDPLSLSPRHIT